MKTDLKKYQSNILVVLKNKNNFRKAKKCLIINYYWGRKLYLKIIPAGCIILFLIWLEYTESAEYDCMETELKR